MPTLRTNQLRIKHLKFVDLLAKLGSLAATADQLSMTPSAASMMLKEIEAIFGVKMFIRQGRGMVPTEQGQGLLPRCRTVLGEVEAMNASLTHASQPCLRIGAFPHTTTTVLPIFISVLLSSKPRWRIEIIDNSADRLLELLLAGEIDLLLGSLPTKASKNASKDQRISELQQLKLYDSELAVVASKTHPLAKRSNVSIEELLEWPWVLPNSQSTTRVAVDQAFLRQGLTPPTPFVESPSYFYSLSLVEKTDLLTCCVQSAAQLNSKVTTVLPIKFCISSSPVALIWRKSSAEANRAVQQLEVKKIMADYNKRSHDAE